MSREFVVAPEAGRWATGALLVVLGLVFAPLFLAGGLSPGDHAGPGGHTGPGDSREPASEAQIAAGQQAFATVAAVLQHPRCLNCHPGGDAPLQFADSRPHTMNVQRGTDGRGRPGQRCVSCHGPQNLPGLHMPPGVASEWRLAPASMAFEGKSAGELAAGLAASGMSGAQLLRHVERNRLVLYGWNPGPGRGPVSVGHEDFVRAFKTWVEAGMPRLGE